MSNNESTHKANVGQYVTVRQLPSEAHRSTTSALANAGRFVSTTRTARSVTLRITTRPTVVRRETE